MTTTGSPDARTSEERTGYLDRVELALPARPELLFLARMTAAAVASRADFGYDQIEDLRLALDELCLTLLGGSSESGRIELQFSWSDDAIEIVANLRDSAPRGSEGANGSASIPAPGDLSTRILDALVDEHGLDHRGETTTSWLRMRRREGG